MRTLLLRASLALPLIASTVAAQEHAVAEKPRGLLDPNTGLMFWTLLIFLILMFVLSKFAFGPITAAVEARERALEKAIEDAKRDREEAAKLLEEHRRQIDAARAEAQQFIVAGREAGEKVRAELTEQARGETQQMLERARTEIGAERDRAIAQLRREAVDLAIRGASKVIEKNLDDDTNRKLVENFLSSIHDRGAGNAGAVPNAARR